MLYRMRRLKFNLQVYLSNNKILKFNYWYMTFDLSQLSDFASKATRTRFCRPEVGISIVGIMKAILSISPSVTYNRLHSVNCFQINN